MEKIKLKDKMIYSDKSLTKKIIYRDKDILSFVLNFQPGQTLPTHNHPGMVTTILVLTGSAKFTVDNKRFSIEKGQIIIAQGEEMVSLINDGDENLSLYVTLTPGPTDDAFATEV